MGVSNRYSIITLFTVLPLALSSYIESANGAQSPKSAEDWQQRNYDTISRIYNTTIYPHNQAFIQTGLSALPQGLFSENVTGRITPIGNYSGFEDTVEYFFGLTPPVQPPLYSTWTKAKIVSFSSGCPEVASSIVWGETTGVNPNFTQTFNKKITTIKQMAFWRFDENGAVSNYDAFLPSLSLYTQRLYGTAPTPAYKTAVIQNICTKTTAQCTGNNVQWDSTEHCVESLTAKDFGNWDEVWGNNVVCRSLHLLLAGIRPDAHCKHVGPTGGGKCENVEYNDVYFDDLDLFGAPPGDTFVCPGVKPWA